MILEIIFVIRKIFGLTKLFSKKTFLTNVDTIEG